MRLLILLSNIKIYDAHFIICAYECGYIIMIFGKNFINAWSLYNIRNEGDSCWTRSSNLYKEHYIHKNQNNTNFVFLHTVSALVAVH